MPKLSVVIPAHNEEGQIEDTVRAFHDELEKEHIDNEILIVNDNSRDSTEEILQKLSAENHQIRYVNNIPPNGIGFAIRKGLANYQGDCVAIVMADISDRPEDLVRYFRKFEEGFDCVFGSRFIKGGKTIDYPKFKYVLNRLANTAIRILFGIKYNDVTNAFKLYSRETIDGLKPFLSHHFNILAELPLKAIVRGYSYTVVPNHWTNRKEGESKLKIKEMGSRYFFIILYCLLEKWLSRGDYRKTPKI
ncbi:MAG: family 2 glycosyl transferase [Candidatus Moranbacteria bacterium GW2011_GWC1_45_18]|nr:MAG: Glycosyl transferase family protein [Candidatus Moranbacteria bacterium GW2011_GWC2_40_12]KKT32670.1 MAG: Glycosyl transferase family protein [Candidatus Moranbacteria bacterium GW2011_GWF2_44_10]KKU00152.1 MAG: family 2 glycosyl transferase [Candidatus Moranbacteria bacterium GW2011_GWC1_45_18]OGI23984.1 MAG: family 2 glycosyl transferase [Candidatus Moranbacteria bacterium RIFOXYA1_FULL_44_8]OGI35214.1 MAG: family 2 glycosyl transferase [Candidatus Moranbacteria bacterium RIFOXYC1_FUL